MRFCAGLYKGELEFFLETDKINFDDLWNIINDNIELDSINKVQITSWTEARSFEKNGLEFYFEEFYDDTPSRFTLRLLPFGGNHSNKELQKLRELVTQLEQCIEYLAL